MKVIQLRNPESEKFMRVAAWLVRLLTLVSIFAGASQFLMAQGTDLGTITGVVKDGSGAVLPNARVVILDLATNARRETKTNSQGVYQVFGLPLGRYDVTISNADMNSRVVKGVQINGSDVVSASAQLKVASATETVEVSSEAPLINTEDQTISSTIPSRAVIDLPRDSRNVYSFLYLNPNITQGSADGEFTYLGGQSYGASFSLDGQRSSGGIFGEPTASQPSLEAVGDINVLTNNSSAEYAGIATI